MKKPFVSVVIPTYNRPYPLCELVESLSQQSFKNFEIVIVNDNGCSVDFISELYPELAITIINQPINQHGIVARNTGISNAAGELIMLIDDDDLIVPGHLQTMVNAIVDADFVYSDAEIWDYRFEDFVRIPIKRQIFSFKHDMELIRRYSGFISSGCLYRKNIHEKIGMLDTTIYNHWDWDLILTVSKHVKVKRVNVAGTLYAFSESGDHLSINDNKKRRESLERLCEKHQLGKLGTETLLSILDQPFVKERISECEIVWDGNPVISRLITNPLEGFPPTSQA
ncbi:Glycosyl transferase family 2 [Evansella caseinilytica]|uniref:Glycosyl transferase family 2 n=1 Tax=Evansella caseinilytica TaxID=1503961 RepID=A0A1H3UIX9_9BACI|nr:glycosyltransferase family 2 protein [Evansella caseinilytica]SDZ61785.1 Glycosyl transferase family 2 [Evansella caseinilytica]